jgi:hypothetical protein
VVVGVGVAVVLGCGVLGEGGEDVGKTDPLRVGNSPPSLWLVVTDVVVCELPFEGSPPEELPDSAQAASETDKAAIAPAAAVRQTMPLHSTEMASLGG